MSLASALAHSLAYTFGIISLLAWSVLAIWNGTSRRERQKSQLEVSKAQHDLWSLEPDEKSAHILQHKFLAVHEGTQLHYIKAPAQEKKRPSLVIFLHGFPDSCYTFARFLQSPLTDHAHVISLDLPGFGGSDSLPDYGADQMMNTVASAIIELKRKHLSGQCILVGHDWGSVVASRLALETHGLIDRVVIVNGVIPRLFSRNIHSGLKDCAQALRTWRQNKSNTQALNDAREAIRPLLAQLLKSNYIFMFRLPFFSTRRFGFVIQHLVSLCHRSVRTEHTASWTSRSRASSTGPSAREGTESGSGASYGRSVLARAMTYPDGDWDTRLRLYREDLFAGEWKLRNPDEREIKQLDSKAAKTFACPASIMFGTKDFALDHRICVEGVEDFFRDNNGESDKHNHVHLLEECGHWSLLEDKGVQVVTDLLLDITGTRR